MTAVAPTKNKCWLIEKSPACFILLGRNGDLIQMCACFKEIHDRTGQKPIVICSHEYAGVLDGVSYVLPHPIQTHWWKGIPDAKRLAEQQYGGGTVLQFWHEPPKCEHSIGWQGKNWGTLQSHGHEHGVDMELDPDYGASMARRCGFNRDEFMQLPLVFDRRSPDREALISKHILSPRRPSLLVTFNGISSPFPHTAEVLDVIRSECKSLVNVVDIGKVRAGRIYDVLGLMDRAIGLVTIDTAALHLAAASKVEYLAFTRGDWSHSSPKGNCTLEVRYPDAQRRMLEVREWVKKVVAKGLG